MKRFIMTLVLISMTICRSANADPDYAVVGAILGATAGLVIGNNVDGFSREIAIPVCAITGGILGHQYGQHRQTWRDRYYRDRYSRYDRHDGRSLYPTYDRNGRDTRYGRWDDRDRFNRYEYGDPGYPVKTVTTERYTPKKINATQFTNPDPHPGVDLIKINVLNANGIRTDVPIMRINNEYIGPQGEKYKSLPTAEQLRRRYGL